MSTIRTKLIKAGVSNLKEFGYTAVDEQNILTDAVYKQFFASMLKDNKGHGKSIDDAIDLLLKEVA